MVTENGEIEWPSHFSVSEGPLRGLFPCTDQISKFVLEVVQNGCRKWRNWMALAFFRFRRASCCTFSLYWPNFEIRVKSCQKWVPKMAKLNGPCTFQIQKGLLEGFPLYRPNFEIHAKSCPKWVPKMAKLNGPRTFQIQKGLLEGFSPLLTKFRN